MSGFFTRRTSGNANSEEGRDRKKGREPDSAPHDFAEDVAQGTPVRLAAFRWFLTHCGTCGLIFLVSMAWMLGLITPIGIGSPFARAEEVERINDVVGEMYTLQLSAEIRAYDETLCRGENPFLRDELEKAQGKYEKQTGRRYPDLPCPKQQG